MEGARRLKRALTTPIREYGRSLSPHPETAPGEAAPRTYKPLPAPRRRYALAAATGLALLFFTFICYVAYDTAHNSQTSEALVRHDLVAEYRGVRAAAARLRNGTAPPPAAAGRPYLAACTRMRNEGAYLREWIEFHRLVGVDVFYLFDDASTVRRPPPAPAHTCRAPPRAAHLPTAPPRTKPPPCSRRTWPRASSTGGACRTGAARRTRPAAASRAPTARTTRSTASSVSATRACGPTRRRPRGSP